MSRWTAIAPIKPPGDRKSRLTELLSAEELSQLGDAMLRHVLDVMGRSPAVEAVILLARTPPAEWRGEWAMDRGRGLNAELQRAVAGVAGPVLMVHADLPALSVEDIAELAATPRDQIAIAPDRHRAGTNAIALSAPSAFTFSFGPRKFRAASPSRWIGWPGGRSPRPRPGHRHPGRPVPRTARRLVSEPREVCGMTPPTPAQ